MLFFLCVKLSRTDWSTTKGPRDPLGVRLFLSTGHPHEYRRHDDLQQNHAGNPFRSTCHEVFRALDGFDKEGAVGQIEEDVQA